MSPTLEIILRIAELLGIAIAAGWISRVLTIRERVRQEKATSAKAEAEARADQIENIEKLVERVYKPTIETLTQEVRELRQKVDAVKDENAELKRTVQRLEEENTQLRSVLREARPDLVPSIRSEQASAQPRDSETGRFVKMKKEVPADGEV